jgi:WD40 repeat protein
MGLCAVGSLDKLVTIWDFPRNSCVLKIDLKKGIQCLRYFNSYQVLLTVGYENEINIYKIDPDFKDNSHIG